jgi:hypothetical protein
MSESDFMDMTHNGSLCNEAGEIGAREFETILRGEIITYIQVRDYVAIMRGEIITRIRALLQASSRRACSTRAAVKQELLQLPRDRVHCRIQTCLASHAARAHTP